MCVNVFVLKKIVFDAQICHDALSVDAMVILTNSMFCITYMKHV